MDAKQLLADAAWLRRLASALAGDADADDVVQESWIAAWRKQPDLERPLRPWLAKVARDVVGMRRRRERRRLIREAQLVDDREIETPDVMLEKVRLQRVLADLVLALAEPYRSAIVARFFEAKSSAQIARDLGIPDATMRARVREGLARLRAGLDRETGTRKAWAALFLRGGVRVAKPTKVVAVIVALIVALLLGSIAWTVRHGIERRRDVAAMPIATRDAPGERPALPADLALPHVGRRIAGRVTMDGRAAAHARVRLVGVVTLECTTDDTGHFDFGAILPAVYSIGAVDTGRLADVQRIDTRDAKLHADTLELTLLPCEGSLFGRVTDASGVAIVGAQVLREDVIGAETDERGHYELCIRRVALHNSELRTTVRAAGYAAQEIVTATDGRHPYDFVLVPEAPLRGHVVDESGTPIAGASLRVTSVERRRAKRHRGLVAGAPATATTDDNGGFVVGGLERGVLHVVARAPGLAGSVDTESTDLTLVLHPSASVHGRVVAGTTPIAGVDVTIDDATALTGRDGSFAIDDAMPGETEPELAPYRPRTTLTLLPGANEVTIEVDATVTVRGTVRQHGTPVANARLMVADGTNYHACYTAADGHFELAGMSAGHYQGGVDTADAYLDLDWTIGTTDATFDLDLIEAGRIEGVVVDSTNSPVANAVVRFETASPRSSFDRGRCTTDAQGAFVCGHMAGGSYKPAVFFAENGQPRLHLEHEPIVLAGRGASVDHVRLVVDARRLAIRGTVTDKAGAVAGVRVVASNGQEGITAPLPTAVTDGMGAFTFTGLAAGTYTLEAETATARGTATVEAGSSVDLVIGGCESSRAPDPAAKPTQRMIWDGRVELLGWDAPPTVRIGTPMTMTLYFRVLQPTALPYDVFVHVAGEHRWINADHTPQAGHCMTTDWKAGDVIVDRFTFGTAVDANGQANPPGTYTIDVGLFRGREGQWENLPTTTTGPITTVKLE